MPLYKKDGKQYSEAAPEDVFAEAGRMRAKLRSSSGPAPLLSDETEAAIAKRIWHGGERVVDIKDEFQVSEALIYKIRRKYKDKFNQPRPQPQPPAK